MQPRTKGRARPSSHAQQKALLLRLWALHRKPGQAAGTAAAREARQGRGLMRARRHRRIASLLPDPPIHTIIITHALASHHTRPGESFVAYEHAGSGHHQLMTRPAPGAGCAAALSRHIHASGAAKPPIAAGRSCSIALHGIAQKTTAREN